MNNEQRAMKLIKKYGLRPKVNHHSEIQMLLQKEIDDYQKGSSDYLRILCGMLYSLGFIEDIPLIKKAKYSINMDVGAMIDFDWIDPETWECHEDSEREQLLASFEAYYQNYFN
ncbi:hypothetical protein [Isobaculum melis]|uniref:Phosphoribosylglycinamide formyltransferase-1 n=1 Tax=Isobaculum melis TaxID=142588 RepID=A0A1H9SYT4_9LACT|nr:hypothetical protein [Isobaculum melis]SER90190.1 phosphoribosylglycinamide formyltransferase-1 [Isobaculum melis]